MAEEEGHQHVGGLGGVRRMDHRRRVVGHEGPGQRQQAQAGVGAARAAGTTRVRGRNGVGAPTWSGPAPMAAATAGEWSIGTGEAPAASAPASEARRSRTPAPSTEQTAGQGDVQPLAPSGVEAALDHQGPTGPVPSAGTTDTRPRAWVTPSSWAR